MKVNPKAFNLRQRKPNVLLLGNGVLRSLSKINGITGKAWEDCVLALGALEQGEKEKFKNTPYTLQATIVAPLEDTKRQNGYADVFRTLEVENNALLRNMVALNWDAILTTNYTYEIENCFHERYSRLKDKSSYVRTIERQRPKNRDTRFLLYTFNQFADSPPIWHIHGEERRPSSIVLTHDEYARLIHRLIEENKLNANKYIDYADDVKYKTWLDYFLMSNLYIVGLGMNFSDFDLWWILNRRARENAEVGTITFFESTNLHPSIKNALESLNVKVMQFDEIAADDYIGLYKRATEDIGDELSKGVLLK